MSSMWLWNVAPMAIGRCTSNEPTANMTQLMLTLRPSIKVPAKSMKCPETAKWRLTQEPRVTLIRYRTYASMLTFALPGGNPDPCDGFMIWIEEAKP